MDEAFSGIWRMLADAQECRTKVFPIGECGNSGIHRLYAD